MSVRQKNVLIEPAQDSVRSGMQRGKDGNCAVRLTEVKTGT
jgi:hypothetical protein